MFKSIRNHWPEYLMESFGLGMFMVSACLFATLLEHPDSAVHKALPDALGRRALMGFAMGLTCLALVYNPWGKRSGAHYNPSVTLTFWRLGKVAAWDAFFYILAQFAGGVAGVLTSALFLREKLAVSTVAFVVTVPGPTGVAVAFAGELFISFVLMTVVLFSMSSRWARLTGLFAATCVALFITFESPYSGMSMNPARTIGSALSANVWKAWWLYFVAPPIGMLLASVVVKQPACAKLHHQNSQRCIFCEVRSSDTIPICNFRLWILKGD